jgi:ATP-dependent helicase HrpB
VFVEAAGQQHPLSIEHRVPDARLDLAHAASRVLLELMGEHPGDALVFLPGAREIRHVARILEAGPGRDLRICPLYGELAPALQDQALQPDPRGRRRVVLATNIAESSLTLDGIRLVVDSGLARRPRFDPNTGLERLRDVSISRASATQRAGRAARQGAGVCVRMWSAETHGSRPAQDPPAILDSDLTRIMLELAAWGVTGPEALRWLDPPPASSVSRARELLVSLGATDHHGHITAAGRAMSALAAHPRLAAMMVSARDPAERALACDLAALLDSPDLFTSAALHEQGLGADLSSRLQALRRARDGIAGAAGLRPTALAQARRVAQALRGQLGVPASEAAAGEDRMGELLLHAYPDRVAARRGERRGQYLLRSGRGAELQQGDELARSELLVVGDLDAGPTRARIYRAAALSGEALQRVLGTEMEEHAEIAWDPQERRVRSSRQRRLGALVLEAGEIDRPDPAAVALAMLDGIAQMGIQCLDWNDDTRQLQARIECLRQWCPADPWPRADDDALMAGRETWLAPWLPGIRRASQLGRIPLAEALLAMVPPALRPRLERWAPTHIQVPSGSRIRLLYSPGAPPVLAVKLQEMFGQLDTPGVCEGRVPVMVHLLSPARRPVQITQDLAGFWRGGYQAVRKELRGRYPRHPWPEDPLQASPTRHTTRRTGR